MAPQITAGLVRRLLVEQYPRWADLPLRPVASNGTDNTIFRLGDDKCVRMPCIERSVPNIIKERQWLPRLAPQLPLRVPQPLAKGEPSDEYPWVWTIYDWIEGEEATIERLADPTASAVALAEFIRALQEIDSAAAPPSGPATGYRGAPLIQRDQHTRNALRAIAEMPELRGVLDLQRLERIWDNALQAPPWSGPPRWAHFDLHAGNLLAQDGRLAAVIDWGMAGAGDPAAELHVAWGWVPADAHQAFRSAVGLDDHAWTRGLGWTLSVALIQVAYYLPRATHPVLTRKAIKCLAALARNSD